MLLLRNRSRTVTKQPLMAPSDQQTLLPSPTRTRPISSFFGSPRFFSGFLTKDFSDTESAAISPTSILSISGNNNNPFTLDKILSKPTNNFQETKGLTDKFDHGGIGLEALIEEEKEVKPSSRKVIVGSNLKIQIPNLPLTPFSPTGSPRSPGDFGTKTRGNMNMIMNNSQFSSGNSCNRTREISTGLLSLSEMELSEEYTCVISRGPVPRTTHIYDNCIVESCCGVVDIESNELKKKKVNLKSPSKNFLSFCHTCKKSLGDGKDIFMYRGEKGFCSEECRYQEMSLDELKN